MKKSFVFGTTVLALALMLIAGPALAAKPTVFSAHLSGKNEVPARETNATGQAKFMVSEDQLSVEFKINASSIDNVVSVRLENAAAGSVGPEIAVLYGPVAPGGGRQSGQLAVGTLTAANLVGPMTGRTIADLVAEIQAGRVYVNILTDDGLAPPDEKPGDFSTGEIRGQIQ